MHAASPPPTTAGLAFAHKATGRAQLTSNGHDGLERHQSGNIEVPHCGAIGVGLLQDRSQRVHVVR